MNAYYDTATKIGVEVAYETEVREVKMSDGQFASAVANQNDRSKEYVAKALIVASGGFKANIPWLKEHWGDAAENFFIPEHPDQGGMLKEWLRHGAKPVVIRAVVTPSRSTRAHQVRRRHRDPAGQRALRNHRQQRGETVLRRRRGFLPQALRDLGKLIAERPEQIAYSIVDSKGLPHFMPRCSAGGSRVDPELHSV